MNLKDLKSKGKQLKPIINIGKSGITESQISHIKKTLKKKKLIKIRFNRSALEEKDKVDVLKEILNKTGSVQIDFIGFNAIIYKK